MLFITKETQFRFLMLIFDAPEKKLLIPTARKAVLCTIYKTTIRKVTQVDIYQKLALL